MATCVTSAAASLACSCTRTMLWRRAKTSRYSRRTTFKTEVFYKHSLLPLWTVREVLVRARYKENSPRETSRRSDFSRAFSTRARLILFSLWSITVLFVHERDLGTILSQRIRKSWGRGESTGIFNSLFLRCSRLSRHDSEFCSMPDFDHKVRITAGQFYRTRTFKLGFMCTYYFYPDAPDLIWPACRQAKRNYLGEINTVRLFIKVLHGYTVFNDKFVVRIIKNNKIKYL